MWLHKLNTCEKRVLQGHLHAQIAPGCPGDCALLVQWLVASSSLATLAPRSKAFTCRCCHGKGHLEWILVTLKGKHDNEGRGKIEAWFKRRLSGSNHPHNRHCQAQVPTPPFPSDSSGSRPVFSFLFVCFWEDLAYMFQAGLELCSTGWPHTLSRPPASASCVWRLQEWAKILYIKQLFKMYSKF